jgi:hypothetical protein
VSFDLRAAHKAAQTEAQRERFEFTYGDEDFSLPPMGEWPISVSATMAVYADAKPEDIDPKEVVLCLRQIVGENDWPRFAGVIPMDAFPILIEQMANKYMGGSMPDLSARPEPDSTRI